MSQVGQIVGTTLFVGIKSYRDGDGVECVGIWADKEKAIRDISSENDADSEFSDPDEGFWGTEEWSITLEDDIVR